jgi:hypothetical protein
MTTGPLEDQTQYFERRLAQLEEESGKDDFDIEEYLTKCREKVGKDTQLADRLTNAEVKKEVMARIGRTLQEIKEIMDGIGQEE